MSRKGDSVRQILKRAVREFENNGRGRRAIRLCEEEVPETFLDEGLKVLLGSDGSAGYRFLAVLLARSFSVFERLTDRWRFTRAQAVKVAELLQRVDSNFDTRLASLLPDCDDTSKPFGLQGENAERALEILDEISPFRRIAPVMRHLTDHSDSKISSKAALLIAKRVQDLSWAKRVVAESTDAQARAAALETMWGHFGPEVMELFRECLGDEDNRVVGNAIIGLHKAGDPDTSELAARIAEKGNPKVRMTAAWAMGQIGDPSFVPILSVLSRDSQPEVRRAALRSLRSLHIRDESEPVQVAAAANSGVELVLS